MQHFPSQTNTAESEWIFKALFRITVQSFKYNWEWMGVLIVSGNYKRRGEDENGKG
jgi:hypothetical protein